MHAVYRCSLDARRIRERQVESRREAVTIRLKRKPYVSLKCRMVVLQIGWESNATIGTSDLNAPGTQGGIALYQAGSSITCPLRFLTLGRSVIFACHADKAEHSSGIAMPAALACMSAA
jgi:hypothetical protein